MPHCPSCHAPLSDDTPFCTACGQSAGTAAAPEAEPTAQATRAYRPGSRVATEGNTGSTAPATNGSFPAGTLLAGRYRVVNTLGRGGMGSVYRAEDLTLGQDVALKFLSDGLAGDRRSAAMMLNEVRLARQITHPNVCRVHDIGEIDGRRFISMEYVDGEDLHSLLRRIGHLPSDKALQIARQLAAGLQAAHAQGVLHRDLKPANVMLDGQGNVRITDFGIAGELKQLTSADSSTGTPAYMAPELFTETTPSQRSDLYSLGLVLYELYTGRSLFRASSMTELLRQHRRPVRPPSEVVPEMDPEVEAVILRCLQRDPAQRPSSAFEVLAALPGSNALAELAAAGRTPSPEQVVACGGSGALCRSTALTLLAVIVIGLIAVFELEPKIKLVSRAPLPYPAPVLAHEARRHLQQLGYDPRHGSAESGFDVNPEFLRALYETTDAAERWAPLRDAHPPAIDFWYRQSPKPLIANHLSGKVTWDDPPQVEPGMVAVRLGSDGMLRELQAVPTALRTPESSAALRPADGEIDWSPLFEATGLTQAAFERAEPRRVPPAFADTRVAWRGERDGEPVRLEAALLSGRFVAISVIEQKWAAALAYKPMRASAGGSALSNGVKLVALVIAVFLAWGSFRRRRGDLKGAFRFALTVFALVVAVTILTAKHTADLGGEGQLLLRGMARGLLVATQYWIFYIALEPHVRRIWPETIISWSRLLQGRLRDPLIGANVLVGIAIGIVATLCVFLVNLSHTWIGGGEAVPLVVRDRAMEALNGMASGFGSFLEIAVYFTGFAMTFMLCLIVLRLLLRHQFAAAAVWTVVQTILWQQSTAPTAWGWLFFGLLATMCTYVMINVGFLAVLVGTFTYGLLAAFPLTTDLGSWLATPTLLALALIGTGIVFGVTAALRPQRARPLAAAIAR